MSLSHNLFSEVVVVMGFPFSDHKLRCQIARFATEQFLQFSAAKGKCMANKDCEWGK